MKKTANGASYITVPKLAKHIGKSKEFAHSIIEGLDKIPGDKKGTKYFIPDVVDRLLDMRRA